MNCFKEIIDSDFLNWLKDYNFKHTQASINSDRGALDILYNDKFCLKIYDRLGHGFGVTISVAEKYDETLYTNDKFSLSWAFRYFQIEQSASFFDRTEIVYRQNLPNLESDIKLILPLLNELSLSEWDKMIEWIKNETDKHFLR